jgi:hypothetical protein
MSSHLTRGSIFKIIQKYDTADAVYIKLNIKNAISASSFFIFNMSGFMIIY